jgi:hypothetical protein
VKCGGLGIQSEEDVLRVMGRLRRRHRGALRTPRSGHHRFRVVTRGAAARAAAQRR